MNIEKILKFFIVIGTLTGAIIAGYTTFETKIDHKDDLIKQSELFDTKLDALMYKIVDEIEKRHHHDNKQTNKSNNDLSYEFIIQYEV